MPGVPSHPMALAGLSAVAATTTLVSLLTWQGFTEAFGDTLGPLFVIAVIVAGTGAVGRWWRLPRPLLVLAQVLLVGMVVSAFVCGSPLPIGEAWDRLVTAFQDAGQSANRFAPPVPASEPPVHPLLIAGGAGCLLLVDILACTLRRVPLAGLPLLTIYSVPVSMTSDSPHWFLYTVTAIGFLGMIFLSESEQIARWGPILAEDHGHSDPKPLAVPSWPRTGARAIGGVATGLSVVVPILIPTTFSLHLFDFGPGSGGDDDISIENPMVDLKRDLIRGEDRLMLTVTTDDPDPSYMRIAVLNRYNDNEWSSGDREVPSSQTADGTMPGLVGVSSELPQNKFDYQLEGSREFRSSWLPTTQLVSRVDAPGDWRYDVSTMDFLASNDDLDTSQLNWSLRAVKVDYDADRLAEAPPVGALVSRDFTELPAGIDPVVRQMALDVTADAPTRYEKAVALQQWFRDRGRLRRTAPTSISATAPMTSSGSSPTRRAAAPATASSSPQRWRSWPASSASPPGSRWASSSLSGSTTTPGPTARTTCTRGPSCSSPGRAGSGSSRPLRSVPVGSRTTRSKWSASVPLSPHRRRPAPSPGRSPRAGRPMKHSRRRKRTRRPASPAVASPGCGWSARSCWCSSWPWWHSARGRLRRRRRDQRGLLGPEDAWQELRDTALDLRLPWPQSRSPWQTREALVQLFGAPRDEFTPERPRRGPDTNPDAVFALDRIVHSLERLRYARDDGSEAGTWRAEMQTCVEALYGGAPKRARRTADWWPRSVFNRTVDVRRPLDDGPGEPAMAGRIVDHVG